MASATTSRNEIEAPIAVMQDTGTKVIMTIMVPGMKKRGGLFIMLKRLLHIKSSNPFDLTSNVKFGQYSLTESSMSLLMEVYNDKKDMKKRCEDVKRFIVSIGRFPTQINPNSVGYNIQQKGENSYIVMTIAKLDNYSTNWKDFFSANGTLDLATL